MLRPSLFCAVSFLTIAMLVLPRPALSQNQPNTAFTLTSSAFPPGGDIADRYTCSGENISPDLTWANVPASARSLALVVDDPDAPSGTYTHWIVYNLDAGAKMLPQGVSKNVELPGGAVQGMNSARTRGYRGPCPPPGKPHRYFFKLYALDATLDLEPGASRSELEKAMQGHIIDQAEIMGRFSR